MFLATEFLVSLYEEELEELLDAFESSDDLMAVAEAKLSNRRRPDETKEAVTDAEDVDEDAAGLLLNCRDGEQTF